jgi:hypothetical protein
MVRMSATGENIFVIISNTPAHETRKRCNFPQFFTFPSLFILPPHFPFFPFSLTWKIVKCVFSSHFAISSHSYNLLKCQISFFQPSVPSCQFPSSSTFFMLLFPLPLKGCFLCLPSSWRHKKENNVANQPLQPHKSSTKHYTCSSTSCTS